MLGKNHYITRSVNIRNVDFCNGYRYISQCNRYHLHVSINCYKYGCQ